MHGWPQLAQTVADVYDALAPADRAKAVAVAQNYGEAAAIEFFEPQRPRHQRPQPVLALGSARARRERHHRRRRRLRREGARLQECRASRDVLGAVRHAVREPHPDHGLPRPQGAAIRALAEHQALYLNGRR